MSDVSLSGAAWTRDWRLGAALLATWAVWAILTYAGSWAPDLSAVYLAGRFYGLGLMDEIYASPARFFGSDYPESWSSELAALGYAGEPFFPYIYPPIWAALAAPFAVNSDPVTFFSVLYAVQTAMLAVSAVLAWRLAGRSMPLGTWTALAVLLLVTSIVASSALYHNQPQIAVSFLVLLSFERLASGRPVAGGAALGLAAALKLSPLLLLAIFVAERQWRGVLAFLVVAGGLALLSVGVAGWELHRVFLDKLAILSDQIVVWGLNYSLESALYQVSMILTGQPLTPEANVRLVLLPNAAWLDIVMLILVLAGAVLLFAGTRGLPTNERLLRRLGGGFLLITLCGPLSWSHHYLPAIFLLPALPLLHTGRTGWLVFGAFALVLSDQLTSRLPEFVGGLNVSAMAGTLAFTALFFVFLLGGRAAR